VNILRESTQRRKLFMRAARREDPLEFLNVIEHEAPGRRWNKSKFCFGGGDGGGQVHGRFLTNGPVIWLGDKPSSSSDRRRSGGRRSVSSDLQRFPLRGCPSLPSSGFFDRRRQAIGEMANLLNDGIAGIDDREVSDIRQIRVIDLLQAQDCQDLVEHDANAICDRGIAVQRADTSVDESRGLVSAKQPCGMPDCQMVLGEQRNYGFSSETGR
jgi:hypothetical protein